MYNTNALHCGCCKSQWFRLDLDHESLVSSRAAPVHQKDASIAGMKGHRFISHGNGL